MDEPKVEAEAKAVELDLRCNEIKQQFHAFLDRVANEVRFVIKFLSIFFLLFFFSSGSW